MAKIVEPPIPKEDRQRKSAFLERLQPWEIVTEPVSPILHTGRQAVSTVRKISNILGKKTQEVEKPTPGRDKIPTPISQSSGSYVGEHTLLSYKQERQKDNLRIVNLDTEPYVTILELPWVPETISIDPVSKLAAIPSIGRNLPFYHYTGAEDMIEFTIDWFFTNDRSRKWAMRMATTIEAWSKADGYTKGLPRIKLICGDLFHNSVWLIEYAPYTLSRFNRSLLNQLAPDRYELIEGRLLPQQITQDIRLKKISQHNLRTEDFIYNYKPDQHMNPLVPIPNTVLATGFLPPVDKKEINLDWDPLFIQPIDPIQGTIPVNQPSLIITPKRLK